VRVDRTAEAIRAPPAFSLAEIEPALGVLGVKAAEASGAPPAASAPAASEGLGFAASAAAAACCGAAGGGLLLEALAEAERTMLPPRLLLDAARDILVRGALCTPPIAASPASRLPFDESRGSLPLLPALCGCWGGRGWSPAFSPAAPPSRGVVAAPLSALLLSPYAHAENLRRGDGAPRGEGAALPSSKGWMKQGRLLEGKGSSGILGFGSGIPYWRAFLNPAVPICYFSSN